MEGESGKRTMEFLILLGGKNRWHFYERCASSIICSRFKLDYFCGNSFKRIPLNLLRFNKGKWKWKPRQVKITLLMRKKMIRPLWTANGWPNNTGYSKTVQCRKTIKMSAERSQPEKIFFLRFEEKCRCSFLLSCLPAILIQPNENWRIHLHCSRQLLPSRCHTKYLCRILRLLFVIQSSLLFCSERSVIEVIEVVEMHPEWHQKSLFFSIRFNALDIW